VSQAPALQPAQQSEIPVFSPRLDELMGAMIKGTAPNVGRFCGYCYTPLGKKREECRHCATSTSDYAPVEKLPMEFGALYRRMRKRESLIVNSFAFAGLGLGVVLFTVLVAIAVYRFDQSLWWLAFATLVLMVGGRVFAGLLGGWIGDNVGYTYARKKLIVEWHEYELQRDIEQGRRPAPPDAGNSEQAGASAASGAR
jgi:hypothetical protein